MLTFLTLFDKNYLSRGLVLLSSLKVHCSSDFTLYILALDDDTASYLINLNEIKIKIITIAEVIEKYPILQQLRNERTKAEFCWTLSSFSIQYVLQNFDVSNCTYIDSDIYFFQDPQILIDEITTESVLITRHNYTPKYDQSAESGMYCVQFMYFKNDGAGNEVLEWWRQQCEDCCTAKRENGKFGDQKYLDDWLTRFSGKVKEAEHIGCGIAPWNIQQFNIYNLDATDDLKIENKITKKTGLIIFYHFHETKDLYTLDDQKIWFISNYNIDEKYISLIYIPYIRKLKGTNISMNKKEYLNPPKKLSTMEIFYILVKNKIKDFISFFNFIETFKLIKTENVQDIEKSFVPYRKDADI